MYDIAEHLIKTGDAYVDEQSAEEMKENRGSLHAPGKNSPLSRPSCRRKLAFVP